MRVQVMADSHKRFLSLILCATLLSGIACAEILDGKTVIGAKVKVSFPELSLSNIAARTDTGAHTSSIHCSRNNY